MWCGRGHALQSGVHGRGVCMVGGICGRGHAWQGGDMHSREGGMHGRGACMAGETATEVGSTHPTGMHSCYCYHPPMELQEGNLFSCVHLSFCLPSVGPHVTITQDAWDLIVQPPLPPPLPRPSPQTSDPLTPLLMTSGGHHCKPVELFHLRTP